MKTHSHLFLVTLSNIRNVFVCSFYSILCQHILGLSEHENPPRDGRYKWKKTTLEMSGAACTEYKITNKGTKQQLKLKKEPWNTEVWRILNQSVYWLKCATCHWIVECRQIFGGGRWGWGRGGERHDTHYVPEDQRRWVGPPPPAKEERGGTPQSRSLSAPPAPTAPPNALLRSAFDAKRAPRQRLSAG